MSITRQIPLYLQRCITNGVSARYGHIFAARAADIIWPGRVVSNNDSKGSFIVHGEIPGIGQSYDAVVAVPEYLRSLGLRLVDPIVKENAPIVGFSSLFNKQFEYGTFDPKYPPKWVMQDFSDDDIKSTTQPFYTNAQLSIAGLMRARIIPLFAPVMPANMQRVIGELLDAGFMVFPLSDSSVSPDWLAVQQYKHAWALIAKECVPISTSALKAQLAQLAAEGDALTKNAAVWETATRIVGAIATMGASEILRLVDGELKEHLKKYAAEKKRILELAAASDPLTAQDLRNKVQEQDAKIKTVLAPLFPMINGLENNLKNQGLGAIQIAAGVSLVVIAGAAILAIKVVIESWGILDGIGKGAKTAAPVLAILAGGLGIYFLYRYINKKTA